MTENNEGDSGSGAVITPLKGTDDYNPVRSKKVNPLVGAARGMYNFFTEPREAKKLPLGKRMVSPFFTWIKVPAYHKLVKTGPGGGMDPLSIPFTGGKKKFKIPWIGDKGYLLKGQVKGPGIRFVPSFFALFKKFSSTFL